MNAGAAAIEIVPVTTPAELDRFIKLPMRLHAADPHYIAPLVLERREAFSAKKNPYFKHADVQFWLARRDGRDVGRISAQADRLQPDPRMGHFGLIAAEDDAAVFAALFTTAEQWLRERGRSLVQGPFNLSINEETGLLIDGFDTPPMLLMGHDHAYVGRHIDALGYTKAKDLIAYLYDMDHDLPQAARRMVDRRRPTGMTVRTVNMRRYRDDVRAMMRVFNDAWSGNWGFIPFTDEEVEHMATSMRPLMDPQLAAIIEMNGTMVGFGITLPNLNEAIADFGGRVLPFNWAKLLWRLKVQHTRTGRTLLMGVSRSFAASGFAGGIAPFLIIDKMRQRAQKIGMRKVELSWILEDNLPMRRINESLGGDPYKTYRVYQKQLV